MRVFMILMFHVYFLFLVYFEALCDLVASKALYLLNYTNFFTVNNVDLISEMSEDKYYSRYNSLLL